MNIEIKKLANRYQISNLIDSLSSRYPYSYGVYDIQKEKNFDTNIIPILIDKYKTISLIDTLSNQYQVNFNTENQPTIKTPQKMVQRNKSKDVIPKDDIYYKPTNIEEKFLINQKNRNALFGNNFKPDEYIETINKLVDNPKINDILECLKSMDLKMGINIQKDLENFKITYTQKARTLKLDDFDEASEMFTCKFLSIIKNDFSLLLDAGMRKLKSNPRDKEYGILMEYIIQYLSEVGFFVPNIHKKPIDKQSNYFEIILTPSPSEEYHGMIKDILRFPYFIAYYDEFDNKLHYKCIKGSCIIYSINCK